jgi:hypothetical protein
MTRIVLAALVLLSCTVFGTEVSAQAGQVTNPPPLAVTIPLLGLSRRQRAPAGHAISPALVSSGTSILILSATDGPCRIISCQMA